MVAALAHLAYFKFFGEVPKQTVLINFFGLVRIKNNGDIEREGRNHRRSATYHLPVRAIRLCPASFLLLLQLLFLINVETMPNLCKCGTVRERLISSPRAKFPNRPYFRCQECGQFDWADQAPSQAFDQATGPICQCGKATVQLTVKKEGANKGRKFWKCAQFSRGCRFFQWIDPPAPAAAAAAAAAAPHTPPAMAAQPAAASTKLPALPGFASYLSDWKTLELIETMMKFDPNEMKMAFRERNAHVGHDGLQVKAVWRIHNKSRMDKLEAAKKREQLHVKLADNKSETIQSLQLRPDYQSAMTELGKGTLDASSGEMFLLHGTSPENLYSILFEGLDPELSRNGLFGRGVYFADNAAKVDMYAKVDNVFQKEGELAKFHEKVYDHRSCKHPKGVRYALICRVLLGRIIKTTDGESSCHQQTSRSTTCSDLFVDSERSKLAAFSDGKVPSSLVAEPGERARTFREYVIFNPDQVFVEYLVAYQRERSLCDCGVPVTERTVSKSGPNRGRKIHLCGKIQEKDQKECDFIQMFPLCFCNQSAAIKVSSSARNPGRKYYCCSEKGQKSSWRGRTCDFFEWAENIPSSPSFSSPAAKRQKS